jgi:hypothetical protein
MGNHSPDCTGQTTPTRPIEASEGHAFTRAINERQEKPRSSFWRSQNLRSCSSDQLYIALTLRYAIDALTAPSALYDYYNPDARLDLAPTHFKTR